MLTCFTFSLKWERSRKQGAYGIQNKAYINSVTDNHYLYPAGQHTLAFHTDRTSRSKHDPSSETSLGQSGRDY